MKFKIELQCQNCGDVETEERSYDQDFVPMLIKTHRCYSSDPTRLGVMLPRLVIKENDEQGLNMIVEAL